MKAKEYAEAMVSSHKVPEDLMDQVVYLVALAWLDGRQHGIDSCIDQVVGELHEQNKGSGSRVV